jgi:Mg2+ and Co2+ transporter CorA
VCGVACLHLTLATWATQGDELSFARVDCLLGERFLVTFHRAEVAFLAGLRSSYREDFRRFARTPSFLLYELWDQWIECGVYGMNFDVLPELHWRYGYAMFWLSVGGIALLVAWLSKRARLL